MNISQTLLSSGFAEVFQSQWNKFNPNDNWFGVSLSHPDARLTNGDKVVELSAQGILTPNLETERDLETREYVVKFIDFNTDTKDITTEEGKNISTLLKNRAVRYIAFKQAGKVIYYSLSGQLPSKEFIQKFIES